MKTTEIINENNNLSKTELNNLAKTNDQNCVSIYIPPPTKKDVIDDAEGQLRLKNLIKKVREELIESKMDEIEVDGYLEPVKKLIEEASIWRKRTKTLIVFLNNQQLKTYLIAGDLPEKTYVADHHYLMPLFPFITEAGKFFLLTLSLQDVKLFEGSREGLTALHLECQLPEKLEDAVGYDYREKSFQFRTGKGGAAGAMFHGQGAGKDDRKIEIEKFFRAVDKGIKNCVKNNKHPLVIACVDEYYPIYAQITKYPNLYPHHISGNVERLELSKLHHKAWSLVESYFQKNRKNTRDAFRDMSAGIKTSIAIHDIIPAAIEGKIEALFLQDRKDYFGLYDKTNRTLILDEDHKSNQESLFNLAAVQTWLNGGSVFIEKKDKMPMAGSEINALFRY